MSTYNIGNVNGPANIGDHGRIEINNGADPAALVRLAERLVERLHTENPALVPQAQIIQGELVHAAQDGQPANRGRIRSALETIGIGVAAGSGSLALAQEIGRVLGL
ncbi:hypothetical protein [Streptomyces viridochromogenes]|uniref:Uncharacterized protein n=1 Tax=Streptomyces viridochromogenes Tue57 TaxID=1160705 RepID=L8PN70_STRVR|nr:hypothetical protein [Streptomyces viridochromogenes]ELS57474.1 hypothetical protein STVIR_1550 [Streptomyces viridochromogenes Tue57]